ncbi:MAG: hypothetical protein Kow00114_03450 [Kiloniellaceae bacterium]
MSDRLPTVAEVVADADAARDRLAALERALQDEIDDIDLGAFQAGRDMTPAEVARCKQLRATQAEVREDFKILAFVTAKRLDNSTEVGNLLRQLKLINAGLEDDLQQLRDLERYAAIAAKVTDTLAKAAEKLARIAAEGIKPG